MQYIMYNEPYNKCQKSNNHINSEFGSFLIHHFSEKAGNMYGNL